MKIYVYPNGCPLKELMEKLHESILLREKSKKTRLSSREIGNHFAKCVWRWSFEGGLSWIVWYLLGIRELLWQIIYIG